LVTLGPYISAFEHAAALCPYLVKGLSMVDRDAKLSELQNYARIVETDFSRFDSTLNKFLMRSIEGTVFRSRFPPADFPDFDLALTYCETTTGNTLGGVRYNASGRCSGDAHTSIGNGLVNAFVTYLCQKNLPRDEWISFHEGDDGIIGVSSQHYHQLIANLMLIGTLGFTVKVVLPASLDTAMFCGRSHYGTHTLTSMCDVRRTLLKFHISTSHLSPRRAVLAKALSYLATDRNTPIIGPLCYSIVRVLKTSHADIRAFHRVKMSKYDRQRVMDGLVSAENLLHPSICPNSRNVLELKEHISVTHQLAIEKEFYNWTVLGFIPCEVPRIESHQDVDVCTDRSSYFGYSYPHFA
jgi:hypothetical protein